MITLIVLLLSIPALFWLMCYLDSVRVARGYREQFEREDARRAALTPEEKLKEDRLACIRMCGFDPGPW